MPRVLVVEDDLAARALMVRRWQRSGYVVEAVGDATSALAAPAMDLYVVDLSLPDLEGLELIRRLRRQTAAPILVATERTGAEVKQQALAAGAQHVEIKPVDMATLVAMAAQLLGMPTQVTAAAAPVMATPSEPAEPPAICAVHPGRILVVEDHEVNRELLMRRLRREGHRVAGAGDGRHALEQLRTNPFDLVLLDVMMPVMDGYATLDAMKADETLREIPVLMISALDTIASVVRCIEAGAADYLPKPYDPVLLRARVTACLEKKRLRDAELHYLRDVAAVTAAATALEAGKFDPARLASVAERTDALGQLARVFRQMAANVQAREQQLQREVLQLRVQIDEARKSAQVSAITGSAYFQSLQQKAQELRNRPRRTN